MNTVVSSTGVKESPGGKLGVTVGGAREKGATSLIGEMASFELVELSREGNELFTRYRPRR